MCNNWPDFPINAGSTGGLIGNTVIICGALFSSNSDDCYTLTSEKMTFVTNVSVHTNLAGSIVLNDNTLWVTSSSSSESITFSGTKPGPDSPMYFSQHAIVAINNSCSMIICGHYGGICYPFYYNHNEDEWINGPTLMKERSNHAAGIVKDEVTNEQFVAVTGGYANFDDTFDSTEILQDGEWVQGKINDMYCMLSFGNFVVHTKILSQHKLVLYCKS